MIVITDFLGRIKEEIDPTQDNYYLHVSYVREYGPYSMTNFPAPIVIDESIVDTSPARSEPQ